MRNEVESWLWRKAMAAMRRYYKGIRPPRSELAAAHHELQKMIYRTGWIMGYRAGMKKK